MYKIIKRIFDFTSALCLFILVSPVIIVLAILVRIKLGSPIFFSQERSTLHGQSFRLLKFRTMTNAIDIDEKLLPDAKRLVPFGTWLRNSSLDELPELINIIKGDMAVIGPRPMIVPYNDFYSENERDRFLVRGGLIPPEVLKNSPTPTWNEQLAWEAEYGRECSMMLDIKIFIETFRLLAHRSSSNYGVYHRDSLINERTNQSCDITSYIDSQLQKVNELTNHQQSTDDILR
jgi:undecaprenyl phosphate N,N'-diacetylbacillosamine 1-phosphate transferase